MAILCMHVLRSEQPRSIEEEASEDVQYRSYLAICLSIVARDDHVSSSCSHQRHQFLLFSSPFITAAFIMKSLSVFRAVLLFLACTHAFFNNASLDTRSMTLGKQCTT